MLKKIELDVGAKDYIQKNLMSAGALAHELAKLPLGPGEIVTFLPEGVTKAALAQYEVGGVSSWSLTQALLVDRILEYLAGSEDRYVVFETLARRGDPILQSGDKPFVLRGEEVLYFAGSAEGQASKVSEIVRKARRHPLLGVLTSLPNGETLSSQQSIPHELLRKLATRAREIIVGAYDWEAVLIWTLNA
jgi:hypothetical protein